MVRLGGFPDSTVAVLRHLFLTFSLKEENSKGAYIAQKFNACWGSILVSDFFFLFFFNFYFLF